MSRKLSRPTAIRPSPASGRIHSAATGPAHPVPPRLLAWSVAVAFSCPWAVGTALAQPVGGQAVHGTMAMTTQGNRTQINTTNGLGTQHSVINWQSFSVPAGTATDIRQPNALSTSIQRVVTDNPTAIFGTLGSNGKIIVVNPAGITIGEGAVVDTAGFTASALRMSEFNARAGVLRFGNTWGDATGLVQVNGHVIARSGDVALLAPQVATGAQALIEAPDGAIILAAGQQAEIVSRGLDGIRLLVQAPSDQAVNLGRLTSDAVGLFAGSLRHSGQIDVQAVTTEGGRVVLKAIDRADVAGGIRAARLGGLGGQVLVTGDTVQLGAAAHVDASGARGGGEALIGGGWRGQDSRLANARETTVEDGARVQADATQSGAGGTVVVWSRERTDVQGSLSARGGQQHGDGGKIETSGHSLHVTRTVDTSAPAGKAGLWLLDPDHVVIQGGGTVDDDSTVSEGLLEFQTGSVLIEAAHSVVAKGQFTDGITMQPDTSLGISTLNGSEPAAGDPKGIDLRAAGSIATRGGNLSLLTGINAGDYVAADIFVPPVDTGRGAPGDAGSVLIDASGSIQAQSILTRSDKSAHSGGDVQLYATTGTLQVGEINTGGTLGGVSGSVDIAGGVVTLTGSISSSGGFLVMPGHITITGGMNGMTDAAGNGVLFNGVSGLKVSADGATSSVDDAATPAGAIKVTAETGNIGVSAPDDGNGLRFSATGGSAGGLGGRPGDGGDISLLALNGTVKAPGQTVFASVRGGDGSGDPGGAPGGNGGNIVIKTATRPALKLDLDADGGNGDAPLVNSLSIIAEGPGGHVPSELTVQSINGNPNSTDATPRGGDGGTISLVFSQPDIVALDPDAARIRASATGGDGSDAASYIELPTTPGAGGHGGHITVQADTLYGLTLDASGGRGGSSFLQVPPNTRQEASGGVGGDISLTATAPAGAAIVLDRPADQLLVLPGRGNPATTDAHSGLLDLRAGAGGINFSGSPGWDGSRPQFGAGMLHLDSAGSQNLGNVTITGSANDLRGAFGPVGAGALILHTRPGADLGTDLPFQVGAATGTGALDVLGDITLDIGASALQLNQRLQSSSGKVQLTLGGLERPNPAAEIVSTQSIELRAHRDEGAGLPTDVRFSPATQAHDPDPVHSEASARAELVINSDEVSALHAPVLRVDAQGGDVRFAARDGMAEAGQTVDLSANIGLLSVRAASLRNGDDSARFITGSPLKVGQLFADAPSVILSTPSQVGRFSANALEANSERASLAGIVFVNDVSLVLGPVDAGAGGYNTDGVGVRAFSQPDAHSASGSRIDIQTWNGDLSLDGDVSARDINLDSFRGNLLNVAGSGARIRSVDDADPTTAPGPSVVRLRADLDIGSAGSTDGHIRIAPLDTTTLTIDAGQADDADHTAALFVPGSLFAEGTPPSLRTSRLTTGDNRLLIDGSRSRLSLLTDGDLRVDADFHPADFISAAVPTNREIRVDADKTVTAREVALTAGGIVVDGTIQARDKIKLDAFTGAITTGVLAEGHLLTDALWLRAGHGISAGFNASTLIALESDEDSVTGSTGGDFDLWNHSQNPRALTVIAASNRGHDVLIETTGSLDVAGVLPAGAVLPTGSALAAGGPGGIEGDLVRLRSTGPLQVSNSLTGLTSIDLTSTADRLTVGHGDDFAPITLSAPDIGLSAEGNISVLHSYAELAGAPDASPSVKIIARDTLRLNAGMTIKRNINIEANTGAVLLEAGDLAIDGAAMTVTGGFGAGHYAAVSYRTLSSLDLASLTFTGGSGAGSDAVIFGPVAPETLPETCVRCVPTWVAGSSPLTQAPTDTGIGVQAPPPPTPEPTPPPTPEPTTAPAVIDLVPQLLALNQANMGGLPGFGAEDGDGGRRRRDPLVFADEPPICPR